MTKDSKREVTYRYLSPAYATAENGLGTLQFCEAAGRSALCAARLSEIEGVGTWVRPGRGGRVLEVGLPEEAGLIFWALGNVSTGRPGATDRPYPPEALARARHLQLEIRDGVSLAADFHPGSVALAEMKRVMTRSLEEGMEMQRPAEAAMAV
jgi:hypothetical protein